MLVVLALVLVAVVAASLAVRFWVAGRGLGEVDRFHAARQITTSWASGSAVRATQDQPRDDEARPGE